MKELGKIDTRTVIQSEGYGSQEFQVHGALTELYWFHNRLTPC